MPSTAGFILSGLLGAATRRVQVQLIGKNYPRSLDRVTGYVLSSALFVGGYYIFDGYVDNNRKLLQRRLAVLREQRAVKDAFFEFEEEPDHRITADKRGRFFSLFDKYGASYK
ncbi:predicted protein [Scheffersomyces stipitis CBS 6054]|uniref:Uncharacterized protein n=1 Tax=Scheffersomyces stipitis (strain ATCC 58785 / CBS 6054 / NBRC 10063 / NRRL Y-11545) TaxID=322104 RepID=A3LUQ8_PICST|nr:predicted protein [Scheffersomyces stipitis CBS 6054]ABN66632.1 predicted protein [Scheffersomyces stipitis CBS 6054]KAG2731332.1 hypothetical protein G9P44_005748 [Scheffersomyces stipitis]